MDIREIRKIARTKRIKTKGISKAELIRAIQVAEGNFDCFGTAGEEVCDQESCLWREDCFIESTLGENSA